MIDDLAALAARIDALHAEQNPDDLSHVLRDAFTQDMIFKLHVLPLVGDIERAKALLEIFDKVCSATYTVSRIDSEAQGRCMTQALQATKSDDMVFKRFRQLCGWTGLLPTSYTIPERHIQQTTEQPVASGVFGNVWEGIYNGERVAMKALRVFKEDDVRKVKKVIC